MGTAAQNVDLDLKSLLDVQRGMVRRREFVAFGTLERVQLEKSAVAIVRGNPLAHSKTLTASLDWYGQGPLVGFCRLDGFVDEQELLVCSPMIHPPPLPDPNWKPPANWAVGFEHGHGNQPFPAPPQPPMVTQSLSDRASGKFDSGDGREWLVFQPIHQILVVLSDRKGWGTVETTADHHGRHASLLYCRRTEEAHFLFGTKIYQYFR